MISQKFRKYRDLLSTKLKDKALRNIRLYDLRHYFGTMTYYRTKDILYTMNLMGHQKIETTLIYTKLLTYGDKQYICRVSKTLEEASSLIEQGFEYITDFSGAKLFRRRKNGKEKEDLNSNGR